MSVPLTFVPPSAILENGEIIALSYIDTPRDMARMGEVKLQFAFGMDACDGNVERSSWYIKMTCRVFPFNRSLRRGTSRERAEKFSFN